MHKLLLHDFVSSAKSFSTSPAAMRIVKSPSQESKHKGEAVLGNPHLRDAVITAVALGEWPRARRMLVDDTSHRAVEGYKDETET